MDDKAGKQAISRFFVRVVTIHPPSPQSKQPLSNHPVNARRQYSRFARGVNERKTHVRWWPDVEEIKIREWKKKMVCKA